ncbi:hypothetical protein SUGI_0239660 [Cryptomeria japonica]|nr:hypothetical protein SUGI_0239660 [Cryptomeria japonica]
MAALDGSRISTGDRSRITDVCYSGTQSTNVGSWSDEADIAFPIKIGRLHDVRKPINVGKANMVQGNRHSRLRLNYGNPYSSGKISQGQTKPGFGDPIFLLKIRTLGRTKKDALTFKEPPPSLSDPVFINRAQWGKDININILVNDFYMIEFMSNKEKWQAKNKGSYILDGIEVHTIDWQPNFNPRTHVLLDNKVWIRLYNCPSDYWHIDVIKDICKDLGTFVSVDGIFEDKLVGSFLRICISTDQITKIPDEVRIIGAGKIWIQKIDREDQLHICPKCFSLDHTGIICDVSAMIQRSYSCMQSPIEVKMHLEPPIAFDTEEAFCNDTLDKENVPLMEATPLIIVPPSSGQSENQQDLLTLLEKTKTLQADIESKLVDSLPPSPFVSKNQLVIEHGNLHSQDMDTGTGGQICSSIGIKLEDGEIETSSSKGEENFEPNSDLILEGTSKGFGKSDSTIDKPNFKPNGVRGRKSKKLC